jgi:hypothetical protein
MRQIVRRNFLKTLAGASTASIFAELGNPSLLGHGLDAPRAATRITDVFMDLNHVHKWDQSTCPCLKGMNHKDNRT